MTDISAWGKSVISSITEYDNRVSFELQDVQKLRFADNSFGRVICSCVLIHVDEPFKAMKELLRVTESGGVCSFYLAAEPGALLRLMRYFITAPKMKNLDVPYNLLNAFSHRNRVDGLIEIAKYVFKDSKIWFVYYPFRIRSWNLSTHVIVNVIKK
jgi:ubiquinone/menaquinone biosynthesis C-methylase UbiE